MHFGFNMSSIEIPTPMALAIVVLLVCLFVLLRHRNRNKLTGIRADLAQARMAISEMDKVVQTINNSTSEYHARLRKLKLRMATLIVRSESSAWHDLCREVDAVLEPTLKLIGEIACAGIHALP